MIMSMDLYLPRLIDKKLVTYLNTFGAVSVEGPKWIGKTVTCEQVAKSAFYFSRRPGEPDPLEIAKLDSSYVFQGESPHLIDEWQLMPEIWDMVRSDVDAKRGKKGLYLLTGSSVPPQKKTEKRKIKHSGAGRIATLKMSTMSLFETGDSTGEVSLFSLFEREGVRGQLRKISLKEIIHFIVRGGWPGNLDIEDSSIIPRDYIERVYTSELDKLEEGAKIDLVKFRRMMFSLARNESTVCSMTTLAKDAGINDKKLDEETVSSYLNILDNLFLLSDQEAFSPDFRSRVRLKIGKKRHFSDPSLAAAIVGANENNLINDLKFLGFLFESLVEHDLKVYMDFLGGKISHYQDYDNDEVDAVVELNDGRYGLIEIKLGYDEIIIENAVRGLKRVEGKLEKRPAFLAIISAMAPAPLRRSDGVYIVPLTSLKP